LELSGGHGAKERRGPRSAVLKSQIKRSALKKQAAGSQTAGTHTGASKCTPVQAALVSASECSIYSRLSSATRTYVKALKLNEFLDGSGAERRGEQER